MRYLLLLLGALSVTFLSAQMDHYCLLQVDGVDADDLTFEVLDDDGRFVEIPPADNRLRVRRKTTGTTFKWIWVKKCYRVRSKCIGQLGSNVKFFTSDTTAIRFNRRRLNAGASARSAQSNSRSVWGFCVECQSITQPADCPQAVYPNPTSGKLYAHCPGGRW